MSRHASPSLWRYRSAACCLLAWLAASPASAQTIADYSRAQRTLLENTMIQAAARSAGMASSAPATAAAVPASAPLPTPPQRPMQLPLPAAPLTLQVSGVFSSRGGALAEVVVNATPYLLAAGDGVPGTSWQVEAIAIDRVVLGRHPGTAIGSEAPAGRKVFSLPAWR